MEQAPSASSRISSSPISPAPLSPDRLCVSGDAAPSTKTSGVYSNPSPFATNGMSATSAAAATATPKLSDPLASTRPIAKRNSRAKKEPDIAGTRSDSEKVKKARKPRVPRDPNAPAAKRRKKSDHPATTVAFNKPVEIAAAAPSNSAFAASAHTSSQYGPTLAPTPAYNQITSKIDAASQYAATIPNRQQTYTSGQRYDPIRSASAENARFSGTSTPAPAPARLVLLQSPIQPRPSPSIASLVDSTARDSSRIIPERIPSPQLLKLQPSIESKQSPLFPAPSAVVEAELNDTMKGYNTGKAMKTASPKPLRKKPSPPLPPLGNGLLSGADFGDTAKKSREYEQPPNECIVIDVPCTKTTGNYVNFLQEVEKKYGFDVAYPRIAEHRRRMAQIAAAGAAIESGQGTADEMSVDLSDLDSDVGMGGVDDDSPTAAESDAIKARQRRKKNDEYDKNDDFIDDTEQAWEEQALASKDGYFVWSGPLVQEGDKLAVERTDGTIKRGRGGRGRGSGRGGAATRGKATESATKAARGGNVTRKPRVKKSDKLALEKSKVEREKVAAALSTTAVNVSSIGGES